MTLTSQEHQAALARFDLAAGYPLLSAEARKRLREVLRRAAVHHGAQFVPGHYSDVAQRTEELSRAAKALLGVDPALHSDRLFATYSGSVAINRAVAACVDHARGTGFNHVEVTLMSPCIDIFKLIAEEMRGTSVGAYRLVESDAPIDIFCDRLTNDKSGVPRAILLASPNNPDGLVLSRMQIQTLVDTCKSNKWYLILDLRPRH